MSMQTTPLLSPHSYFRRTCAVAALGLALSACVNVPPDAGVPHTLDASAVRLPDDLRQDVPGAWPGGDWWRRYGDAQLDRLVDQTLHASPTLQAAAARVHAAQAALDIAHAQDKTGVEIQAGANRQHYSAHGLFPAPIGGGTFNDFALQIGVNKDLDLWGAHRALIVAAAGEQAARQAEQAQVRQALALSVAQSYFEFQADGIAMVDLRQQADARQALLADAQRRQMHGLASSDDALAEQGRLDDVLGQLAQVQAHALSEREALRALTGNADAAWLDHLAQSPLPPPDLGVPKQLGFELLARRPDLQAAHWRVEAALGRVQAAQAAFYPRIDLGASIGLDALSLSSLLQAGSRTFVAGPSLSLPIFHVDSLKGELASARSTRDELIADYDQQVLDATREVAQAAAAIRGLEQRLQQQRAISASAAALKHHTQARLRQGLANQASLLRAGLALHQDQQAELQLTRQQLQEQLSLIRALGGGYRAGDAGTSQTGSASMATPEAASLN